MVQCRNLSIGYNNKPLLKPISLVMGFNEIWSVSGENGSGKSTFIKTLLGIIKPIQGEIIISKNICMAYFPQREILDSIIPLRVVDVVQWGNLYSYDFVSFKKKKEEKQQIHSILQTMGLLDLKQTLFRELSEGQKQKVMFARILHSRANLIVLDEPTSSLDKESEKQIMEILKTLASANRSVIMISHSMEYIKHIATHQLYFNRDKQRVELQNRTLF